ncbi:biotin synthase BioB [Planctomycetota bacterium]
MTTLSVLSDTDRINLLASTVIATGDIEWDDAIWLSTVSDPYLMDLFAAANRIRYHFVGNTAHVCSIVNAKSGRCSEDCGFCAQSSHFRTSVETFELIAVDEMVAAAEAAAREGSKKFGIVISGREINPGPELDAICRAIEKIRDSGGIIPDASLGIVKDPEVFSQLKAAGLRHYHHNLETARSHHGQIVSTHSYDDEYDTVRLAGEMGLEMCSGGIFGMGESWSQRVEMAFDLKTLNVSSVPLNFLVPVKGTRLEDAAELSALDVLKICALYRFVLPRQNIALCGGREHHLGDWQGMMLLTGANGFMLGNYLTTTGRSVEDDLRLLEMLGWEIC